MKIRQTPGQTGSQSFSSDESNVIVANVDDDEGP